MSSSGTTNDYCTTPYCWYDYCKETGYTALNVNVRIATPGHDALHCQINIVAYNVTQLRILWQIKSDGTTLNNFTASSQQSTDKGVVNLKNDIVEKYWQSTGCTTEWVVWDSGSGKTIALDTFALILNNLTGSAVVTLKGYGDGSSSAPADWSTVPVFATLPMPVDPTETNLIWISPSVVTSAYRWWRLDIADPTNPAGYITAGRLVAGQSLIFNGENCLDALTYQIQNYKDEMQLNGFTTIANNRALKKYLRLSFRDLNRISLPNYLAVRQMLQYSRDTLKSLVIVDPSTSTSQYLYTVFAKLKQMPQETHKYTDSANVYATFDLEFDEGR